jgi:hypothetical protein
MVAVLCLAPSSARGERAGRDAAAIGRAQATVERLRAELARVNAEVATLKHRARTVRNDYRLRERMADAEALAQKLTAAEAALSRQTSGRGAAPSGAPIMAPPQASPQDGSVELEAKADLLSDQARKLVGEADALARAAAELRSRRSMRRKAGSWDRDPFAGLETSRRNVLVSAPSVKLSSANSGSGTKTADSSTQGSGTLTNSPPADYGPSGGTAAADNPVPVVAPSAPGATETAGRGSSAAVPSSTDGTSAAKSSPQPQLTSTDRQSVEQRLYLDPATAAELRQALGTGSGALEPEALDRGAAALRARARALSVQARALRARSLVP